MMRKVILIVLIVLVLVCVGWFVSCGNGDIEPTPPTPTPTETMNEVTPTETNVTPTPTEFNENDPTPTGVIEGDVLFNDVELGRLFEEPFVDVLGEPIEDGGNFIFYEVLEFSVTLDEEGNLSIVGQIMAFAPNLGMFEINGITLDSTRTELIAAFGIPYISHDSGSISYRISSPVIDYLLTLSFENLEEDTYVSHLTISRSGLDSE